MLEHQNITNSNHIQNMIFQHFLKNNIVSEISNCMNHKQSCLWQIDDIQLIIQDGDIICCTTPSDWLWIVRRISVIYYISHAYAMSALQKYFDVSAFPFLEPMEICNLILERTEHNLFVLCNTSHKTYNSKTYFDDITDAIDTKESLTNELALHETTIQTIRTLKHTGDFHFTISVPKSSPTMDLLWKHRHNKNRYTPLLSSVIPSNTTLQEIFLQSDLEPYHTLQQLTSTYSNSKKKSVILGNPSHFFVSQKESIQHHIFETILDGIIDHIKIQMTHEKIRNWFSYHIEYLPIESQISLYRICMEDSNSISDQQGYYQALSMLLFRLSKSKLLQKKRSWIHHQLLQIQCF